ncbi:MAG TPA: transglycosylase SLT domain-containing protein [Pyrinomonadaceae bacterium]
MTRKYPSTRLLSLSGAAILFAGFVTASAQESAATLIKQSGAERAAITGGRTAKPAARRAGPRRLVKIRVRAGDTLNLLGDRFGTTADEIAEANGIIVGAQLKPGSELLIPLPSPEALAKASLEKLAQHSGGNSTGADSSAEADGSWENVQGVWFRRGGGKRANEINQTGPDENNSTGGRGVEANNGTRAKIVEVSDALRSTAPQPVWIHLVGGARVEADSVKETEEGAWYTRGPLTIFIERSRIERIEREREGTVSEASPAWRERGWTTGNAKFDALIKENGARFGVDPYLIFCVMEQESQFKPWVVSPKGARGLMQLMPGTGARFGVRRPFDPAENIMGGTRYLKQLLENFGGRVDLVLAGYNAGEGAVMKYGRNVPPYRETRNYVQRISKRYGQNYSAVAVEKETAPAPPGLR